MQSQDAGDGHVKAAVLSFARSAALRMSPNPILEVKGRELTGSDTVGRLPGRKRVRNFQITRLCRLT